MTFREWLIVTVLLCFGGFVYHRQRQWNLWMQKFIDERKQEQALIVTYSKVFGG